VRVRHAGSVSVWSLWDGRSGFCVHGTELAFATITEPGAGQQLGSALHWPAKPALYGPAWWALRNARAAIRITPHRPHAKSGMYSCRSINEPDCSDGLCTGSTIPRYRHSLAREPGGLSGWLDAFHCSVATVQLHVLPTVRSSVTVRSVGGGQ
jgi:hypothetical protein